MVYYFQMAQHSAGGRDTRFLRDEIRQLEKQLEQKDRELEDMEKELEKEKKVNFWMYGEVMGNNSRCPVKETKKRCELE